MCIDLKGQDYNNVGNPIPGIHVSIIKDDLDRSCIYISSPETIGSYIYPDRIEQLGSDLYKTGDVGTITENGAIILQGRIDNILIVDGKKVNKNYVADIITQLPTVKDASVYLRKNEDATELVCEYISDNEISKGEFFKHCRKTLADYQIPKIYIKVDAIQRKKTWKVEFN